MIAFSPAQKGLVYAKVETAENTALYASLDAGDSWERRGNVQAQPMYYKNIHADPKDPDRVYVPTVQTQISEDGGRTFQGLGERNKHVDNHYIWIDPDNTNHLLEGCDGGLYETWDRGQLWRHFPNLSVTQFYNVEVDNASPIYNVYGGTQDNATLGGPSRSRSPDGATNNDWWVVTGGDGFVARIDPTDPNIVYGESQYAGIVRLDRRTAERVSIRPVEGKDEEALRFNWETPFIISPHNPSRLVPGREPRVPQRRSRQLVASDQSRSDAQDRSQPAAGDGTGVAAGCGGAASIDGHVGKRLRGQRVAQERRRADRGNRRWRGSGHRSTAARTGGGARSRPDCPDYGSYGVYVQRVHSSKIDEDVAYALFDNSKNGDFKPYIYKSTNKGASWTSISGDLPANGPALSFAEDHVDPDLLFVGTEFGLFFTVDGGRKWVRLRNNLPTIPVRDLAIQERENDLVLATFGRGFYVLDDYSPLEA